MREHDKQIKVSTCQEFNIKWGKYLEDGHYGMAIEILEVISFIDGCFKTFSNDPNFTYSQIKLKFNMARFYSTANDFWTSTVESEVNRLVKIYDRNKNKVNG